MKYTTILFDADDTLLDFKRAEHDAIFTVLSDMGLPSDDATIAVYSDINDSLWKALERGEIAKNELKVERFRRLCQYYNFTASPEEMANRYIYTLAEQSYLIPGAETLCHILYENGAEMYIVTNGVKYIQKKRFNATPLVKFFKKSFISEEVGFEKPRKEFFDAVFSEIKDFDPSKTIIIGDSATSDMKGGVIAGIDTCWYNPKNKKLPCGMTVTYEIHDLKEVLGILGI